MLGAYLPKVDSLRIVSICAKRCNYTCVVYKNATREGKHVWASTPPLRGLKQCTPPQGPQRHLHLAPAQSRSRAQWFKDTPSEK